jgi:hypothetical protein
MHDLSRKIVNMTTFMNKSSIFTSLEPASSNLIFEFYLSARRRSFTSVRNPTGQGCIGDGAPPLKISIMIDPLRTPDPIKVMLQP